MEPVVPTIIRVVTSLAAVLPSLRPQGALGWLAAATTATTVAQLATLPLLVPTFGELSLVSIPANLLLGPAIQVAFPLAAVASAVGLWWPQLGEAVAAPAGICAEYAFLIVGVLGGSDDAVATVASPSRPMTIALYAFAITAVTAASTEGRAWMARIVTSVLKPGCSPAVTRRGGALDPPSRDGSHARPLTGRGGGRYGSE